MSTTTKIKVGESAKTITLPEGMALTIKPTEGSSDTAGVAYLLDQALGGTNSKQSWQIGATALAPISGYEGTQKVLITCTAGSIDAVVGDAALVAPAISKGDSATSSVVDPNNPAAVLSPIIYSSARAEGRWADAGALRTMYADVINPLAVAVTGIPCRVAIGFGQGEVFSPDQLRVRDASGAIVPWQWEGGEHPLDGTSLEKWPDGSLRCGDIWFNLTASANAKSRYLIEKHPIPLGQSFAQNVVYTAVSGSIDELATTATRCRFESDQAWNMRRYQDIANSSFDLFTGSQGIFTKLQPVSGTGYLSYTAADVVQGTHGVIGAGALGYGIVFQIYETNYTDNHGLGTAMRVRYRVFADGSVHIDDRKTYTTALTSSSRGALLQARVGATGLTDTSTTTDESKRYMRFDYAASGSGSYFMIGAYASQRESEAGDTSPGTYTMATHREDGVTWRFGWSSTTAINAGVVQRHSMWLCKYTAGDAVNEHARRFNRLAAIATQPRPETDLASLRRLTQAFAAAAQPMLTINGWGGVSALFTLFLTGNAANALAEYQAFCTSKGINPATSADYLSLWTSGSQGFEYQGRNTQVLWWLREAFRKAGDTTNQSLAETYIHAFADMCVGAESSSGGAGKVKLSGTGSPAWNAATSALAGIAASLAITANATRQTVFNRITSTFAAGNFSGPIWSYNDTTDPVTTPTVHYSAYQLFELGRAYKLQPGMTLPVGDLCNYLRQAFAGEGICDEWYCNLRYRQGRWTTQAYSASCLALLNSDMGGAYELVRHVQQATGGAVGANSVLIDGYTTSPDNDGFNGFDTRALVEVLNWLG